MKVYLATQTISNSVANAIEICDAKLKLKEFENSSETCKFLRIFNRSFDLLDSKARFNPVKPALMESNKLEWSNDFNEIESYILSLHHAPPVTPLCDDGAGPAKKKKKVEEDTRVVVGPRKRGFIGFLINIQSYREIFRIYVTEKCLIQYLLGHKLSQDHLESLFGGIRSSQGLNNNPNIAQFRGSLRKLLLGATHMGQFENTISQDDTFLPLPPSTTQNFKFFSNHFDLEEEEDALDFYTISLDTISEYKSLALNYIAGYVQWKIVKKETCEVCKLFLSNLKICNEEALITKRNRGGLTIPSIYVDKIIKISELVFMEIMSKGSKPLEEKNLIEKVSVKICSKVYDMHPDLFSDLPDHMESFMGTHQNLLIKKIVSCFMALRLKHHLREQVTDVSIRIQLSKLILYKNK